jgi:hypothetical protein
VLIDRQSAEADPEKRKVLVWQIEKILAEDGARPIIFFDRRATCWQPQVKGFTIMINSIFNGVAWRMSGSINSVPSLAIRAVARCGETGPAGLIATGLFDWPPVRGNGCYRHI